MGMTGCYIAVSEIELSKIISGEMKIYPLLEDEHEQLDIDKAWDMLHFSLTGERGDGEAPMCYVVPLLQNQGIDSDELDFGAGYLFPNQVKEASAYLETLTEEKIRELYDFDELTENEVYCVTNEEDDIDYISSFLPDIKSFFEKASQANNAIVFLIL